jgi:MbtH protein
MPDDDGQQRFKVVINDEEQYSIWFADRTDPPGWHGTGVTGSKEDCLAHIEEMWTDMRPLSLRRQMAGEPLGH